MFADFGKKCPVHHYEGRFDFYIASNYNDIKDKILRDHKVWSAKGGNTPRFIDPNFFSPISSDPPIHHEYRDVVRRGFSPDKMKLLSAHIERISNELIDAMLAAHEPKANFFESFAMPLAARLMCIMLGAPEANYLIYKKWADQCQFTEYNVPEEDIKQHMRMVGGHFAGMILEREQLLKTNGVEPALEHVGTILPDDFLSRYICETVEGRRLNRFEVLDLILAILIGGNETTMNLMTNLLWRLLEVPERWEQLKRDPALIPAAIEESLRFDPPVLGLFRNTACPAQLGDVEIPEHAKVFYNVAAANRDPARWPDPDDFRLDRPTETAKQHLSFSGGAHACLGMSLARMEVKQVFERLVARMPGLRLDGQPKRAPGFNFWGLEDLPVAWDR
jgi:cytochrome P450